MNFLEMLVAMIVAWAWIAPASTGQWLAKIRKGYLHEINKRVKP